MTRIIPGRLWRKLLALHCCLVLQRRSYLVHGLAAVALCTVIVVAASLPLKGKTKLWMEYCHGSSKEAHLPLATA